MALFGFGKKKEKETGCCSGDCKAQTVTQTDSEKTESGIKVLGSGCAKCNELERNTREALEILGMEPVIDHVTDFARIAAYGVMSTPVLVVDGKVVSYGKVLKKDEVIKILQKVREEANE